MSQSKYDMTLLSEQDKARLAEALAVLASGAVPWIALRVFDRTLVILHDDFDEQLRAGIVPELPRAFVRPAVFSLSMFREAIRDAKHN